MKRRSGVVAALVAMVAALVAIVATTATAKSSAPAAKSAAGRALVSCKRGATIGFAVPATGPAASLGQPQRRWARFFVTRWNATHKKFKITMREGDTQLPNVAEATKVAQSFASNSSILGVVGPAGSQEVVGTTPILQGAGLAFVSGSATRTTLTDGSRTGFFFRVVPPDAVQGPTVARFIVNKLKKKNVLIIDDQETYSTGLAADAAGTLRNLGATVSRDSVSQSASDFSALISRISSNVQVVYIPWQLPPKAQLFAQQMREQGKRQILLSSDGTFDPSTYKPAQEAYASNFPVAAKSKLITSYKRTHGGEPDFFGAPTYAATQVVVNAVSKACANGSATRAEVRANIRKTNIPAAASVIGLRLRFTARGDLNGGRFGLFKVTNGNYTPVG
ncbi:MAG: branched-chain amino acid ABC transporter substrate-binding protein [Gaiellaceae bacterium]